MTGLIKDKEKNIPEMKKIKWLLMAAGLALVLAAGAFGCSNATTTTSPAGTTPTTTVTGTVAQAMSLNGAGATFPNPLYSKWFAEYNTLNGVEINYQAIGSGGGISQITEGTVDFGASDGIMTAEQLAKAETAHGPILHIPMASGAVAVIFNLEGVSAGQLRLTSDVLADIYLKKIAKWNDARITSINPGVSLPSADIAVVHRSDGSGTTFIFTNYLSKISSEWQSQVGNATSVQWPGDIGGQGNAGVAGQVQQIPGSIGYVELAYALQNNIPYATLKNAASNYIAPTLAATTKAAEGITLPADMKIMITNSSNPDAYPISGFTWILAYVNQTDQAKGLALVNVLWWNVHDGQQYTTGLDYAPLSAGAVAKAEAQIRSISYQGQPLLNK
jgi:phosphate transport system substrate-binding protein